MRCIWWVKYGSLLIGLLGVMGVGRVTGEPSPGLYWLALRSQPQEEVLRRVEEAAQLQLELLESRYRQALEYAWLWPDRADFERQAWVEAQREVRAAAFREIERIIEPEQQAVAVLVKSLGGKILRRYASINLMLAELPEGALGTIRQDDRVAGAWPDPGPISLVAAPTWDSKLAAGTRQARAEFFQSAPPTPAALSMGAGPLWEQNINGAGEWVAVIATGLKRDHPMFNGVRQIAGISFLSRAVSDPDFADDSSPWVDFLGSTGFGSLLVGQGAPGGWEGYRGAAWGASLLVIKANYRRRLRASGDFTSWTDLRDLLDAWEWLVRSRSDARLVWSLFPEFTEYYATTYDLFSPIRSGMIPESQQGRPNRQAEVSADEGGLHSLLTVASVDTRGTPDRSDDSIAPASARGPSSDGRRKPDVAAPAWGLWGAAGNSNDIIPFNFTSNGPVNVLGAAALLRQAGVRGSLQLKALLINSADRTQWSTDWGWGAVDVNRAYQQRQGVLGGTVAPAARVYYRGSVQGAFSATLAWNRQVRFGNLNSFPWDGCLANLDLRVYRADSGALVGASTSPNDSVERVIGRADNAIVVKVSHAGNPCRNPEPFALAISEGTLLKLNGPSLSASCAAPPQVVAGRPFTLTCTVTNRGDLIASRVTASLQLGTQSAAVQLGFGDVGPGASSQRSVTLDAPATTGSLSWQLEATGTSFEDRISQAASGNLNVVAAGTATQPVIALSPTQFYLQVRATDAPVSRKLQVNNSGAGTLNWTASSNQAWLQVTPNSGSGAAELNVTVQPGLLPAAVNLGNVTISAAGLPAQSVVVTVELIGGPASGPVITEVVNGASFQSGFAPGSWVSIRGARLAPASRIWQAAEIVNGQLPVSLDGVQVKIGNREAPVYYISPEQLNVLAPDDESEGQVQVEVITPSGRAVATGERRRWDPGVFVYQAEGRTLIAALHANSAILVAPVGSIPGYETRPARPGDYLQLYATGLGLNTRPRPPFGRVLEAPAELLDEVRIWVGGSPARVLWTGLVSPGLYQINFETPNAPAGDQPVEIQVGGSGRVRAAGVLPVGP